MKQKKMNDTMKSELIHIPRGSKGSLNNLLRTYYNMRRRNDLAQENPRGQSAILKEIVTMLRVKFPDFDPDFNKNFFTL